MKKVLAFLFSLTIILTCLAACSGGGDVGGDVGGGEQNPPAVTPDEPVYSTEISFDETGHYYAQLNGDGKKDYKPHYIMRGKCLTCGYYAKTDDIRYELKYEIVNGEPEFYYAVAEYLNVGMEYDIHIEIPVTHKQNAPVYTGESDDNYDAIIAENAEVISATEYPVLEISDWVFNKKDLQSIKLNEGLKTIGNGAFAYTSIKSLVIPNSVVGKITQLCVGCTMLKSVVIGDGITLMDYYNFTYCSQLQNVKIGKNVTEIRERNFYECVNIEYLVIPKSVISIPESEIYFKNVDKYIAINNLFQGGTPPSQGIYFEITKEEYNALCIPLLERDKETGLTVDPITKQPIPFEEFEYTSYGYVEGWCANSKLFFLGEWEYDENGKPTWL